MAERAATADHRGFGDAMVEGARRATRAADHGVGAAQRRLAAVPHQVALLPRKRPCRTGSVERRRRRCDLRQQRRPDRLLDHRQCLRPRGEDARHASCCRRLSRRHHAGGGDGRSGESRLRGERGGPAAGGRRRSGCGVPHQFGAPAAARHPLRRRFDSARAASRCPARPAEDPPRPVGARMILVALGANLPSQEGAPRETLRRAVAMMPSRGLVVIRKSRIFLTEPVPRSHQPWYANQVVVVDTTLPPEGVLSALLEIEQRFGRERGERDAARSLDLDLIAYGDVQRDSGALVLPHPRMHERAFVLAPLVDVAPEWRHPRLGETATILLARTDRAHVRAMRETPLLMGVVNVTPDSFSDGGRFDTADRAIEHARLLIEQGADILDIGGESTRPGSDPVSLEEEQARVLPVLRAIAGEAAARGRLVSIDTRHASTMAKAIEAGATMINDVTALA